MRLTIEIKEITRVESFLAIVALGVLECYQKGKLTTGNTMELIFRPSFPQKIAKEMPKIADILNRGCELEDIESLLPNHLSEVIETLKERCFQAVEIKPFRRNHVSFKVNFDENEDDVIQGTVRDH